MKRICIIGAIVSTISGHANAKCTTKVGDSVQTISAKALYERLSVLRETKGQFETTKAFEKRTQKSREEALGATYRVEIAPSVSAVEYDADHQRFKISEYVSGVMPHFADVFTEGNPYHISRVYNDEYVHGIGIFEDFHERGSYEASNAFGATVTAHSIQADIFSVFDRTRELKDKTWKNEYVETAGDVIKYETGGVYLKAPAEAARALKEALRFSVEMRLKEPFLAEGKDYIEATWSRPTDGFYDIHVFIADMSCVLITDDKHQVLKTVPVAY